MKKLIITIALQCPASHSNKPTSDPMNLGPLMNPVYLAKHQVVL